MRATTPDRHAQQPEMPARPAFLDSDRAARRRIVSAWRKFRVERVARSIAGAGAPRRESPRGAFSTSRRRATDGRRREQELERDADTAPERRVVVREEDGRVSE